MKKALQITVLTLALAAALFSSPSWAEEGQRTVLPNGVVVVTQGARGGIASACLFIKVGAKDEGAVRSGLTDLVDGVLLSCDPMGRKDPPALRIEQLGGFVTAETGRDYTCFRLSAPIKNFGPALRALAEIFKDPRMPESSFAREREALLELVARDGGMVEGRAYPELVKRLQGSNDDIDESALGRHRAADAERWYTMHYRPEKMVLSLCGRFTHAQAVKAATGAFGNIVPPPMPAATDAKPSKPRRAGDDDEEEAAPPEVVTLPARQGAVLLGMRAPAPGKPGYAAAYALEGLLSGGLGSDMYRRLRSAELAYFLGGQMPAEEGLSLLTLYAATDADKVDKAAEVIKGCLDGAERGGITDEDLLRAKKLAAGRLPEVSGTTLDRAFYAGLYEARGVGAGYGKTLAAEIEKLTKDDLARAARTLSEGSVMLKVKPARWY